LNRNVWHIFPRLAQIKNLYTNFKRMVRSPRLNQPWKNKDTNVYIQIPNISDYIELPGMNATSRKMTDLLVGHAECIMQPACQNDFLWGIIVK
jgi:hypothetical protein